MSGYTGAAEVVATDMPWRAEARALFRTEGYGAADAALIAATEAAVAVGRSPVPASLERLDVAILAVLPLVATDAQQAASRWETTVADVTTRVGPHPRGLLVDVEVAEACLRLAAFWGAEVELGDADSRPLALESIRQGVARLVSAEADLKAAQRSADDRPLAGRPTATERSPAEAGPSPGIRFGEDAEGIGHVRWWDEFAFPEGPFDREDIRRLAIEIDVRAYALEKLRADLFPRESVDRIAALTAARGRLDRLMGTLAPKSTRRNRVRLELARIAAELGDTDLTKTLIADAVREAGDPAATADTALAAAQIALDGGRDDFARTVVESVAPEEIGRRPEWSIVRLTLTLRRAKAAAEAGDTRAAATARAEANTILRELAERFGTLWARRGRAVILATGGQQIGDPITTTRLAAEAFGAGEFDRAADLFVAARDQGLAGADRKTALAAGRAAGLIHQSLEQFAAAATVLRQTALALPKEPEAATMHLAAAWNIGQAIGVEPAAAADYETTLREHLAQFPASGTTNTARAWLAGLLLVQDRARQATEVLLEATPDRPDFGGVLERLSQSIDAEQLRALAAGVDGADRRAEVARRLRSLVATLPEGHPERPTGLTLVDDLERPEPDAGPRPADAPATVGGSRPAPHTGPPAPDETGVGSPTWQAAKQARIETLIELGQSADAESLRRYVDLLAPRAAAP